MTSADVSLSAWLTCKSRVGVPPSISVIEETLELVSSASIAADTSAAVSEIAMLKLMLAILDSAVVSTSACAADRFKLGTPPSVNVIASRFLSAFNASRFADTFAAVSLIATA